MTILQRKLGLKSQSTEPPHLDSELETLLSNAEFKSNKRTEENNKFVFKHAIKLLKKSLK